MTVRRSIVVEASIEAAFKMFSARVDRVKPREHNLLMVEIAEPVFERRRYRGLDRYGDSRPVLRDGIAGADGWPLYRQRFAGLFTREG